MVFLDKTFCSSPNCQNKCGRKMTDQEDYYRLYVWGDLPVAMAAFCDEQGNLKSTSSSKYKEKTPNED